LLTLKSFRRLSVCWPLKELRERILGTRARPLDFRELAQAQQAERKMLQHCDELCMISSFRKFTNPEPSGEWLERRAFAAGADRRSVCGAVEFLNEDQQRIREVLTIITGGQELDLQRFGAASERNIIALQTDAGAG
jgi:hypothetical protein